MTTGRKSKAGRLAVVLAEKVGWLDRSEAATVQEYLDSNQLESKLSMLRRQKSGAEDELRQQWSELEPEELGGTVARGEAFGGGQELIQSRRPTSSSPPARRSTARGGWRAVDRRSQRDSWTFSQLPRCTQPDPGTVPGAGVGRQTAER